MEELTKYPIVLNIAGELSKIVGLFGGAKAILENTKPNLITGISSGAILSVPLALGLYEDLEKTVLKITTKDIVKLNPYKEHNSIFSLKAVWRILMGKPSLGVSNIPNTLKKLITPELFDTFKYGDYPDVEIGVVDFLTGEMLYYKVKDLNYTDYIILTTASSSIPLIHEPVYYQDRVLYDGGVKNQIATLHTVEKYNPEHCYNVYSRPLDNKALSLGWKVKGINSILNRKEEILSTELQNRSNLYVNLLLKESSVKLHNVYLPRILTGLFDVNKKRLNELYRAGYERGLTLFN